MARIVRSKINDKYFEKIPNLKKPKVETSRNEIALEKSMALADLVGQRTKVLRESREIRKRLYNLSQEIHSIEIELSELFMEGS